VSGLSIRAYARHRGVSHTAVRKALANGRITAGDDGLIDAQLADRQWASATDVTKPRNSVAGAPKRRRAPHTAAEPLQGMPSPHAGANGATDANAARLAASYAPSRGMREGYLARIAKLEYEQMAGKLIDADEARAAMFVTARLVRENLLGIPSRLAPVIAGLTDRAEIQRLLEQEISTCLAELANTARILKATTKPELPS